MLTVRDGYTSSNTPIAIPYRFLRLGGFLHDYGNRADLSFLCVCDTNEPYIMPGSTVKYKDVHY
jgi:hypothetical protein